MTPSCRITTKTYGRPSSGRIVSPIFAGGGSSRGLSSMCMHTHCLPHRFPSWQAGRTTWPTRDLRVRRRPSSAPSHSCGGGSGVRSGGDGSGGDGGDDQHQRPWRRYFFSVGIDSTHLERRLRRWHAGMKPSSVVVHLLARFPLAFKWSMFGAVAATIGGGGSVDSIRLICGGGGGWQQLLT